MQPRRRSGSGGRAFVFIGVSVIAGLGGGAMLAQFVHSTNQQVEAMKIEMARTVDVVVATRTLYKGLPIQEEDVALRALHPDMVAGDLVFDSIDEVVGRMPRERVLPNEILRTERLAKADAGEGITALIRSGKRAVSVALKAEEAVAGFIEPGAYVDVVAVIRPDDKEEVGARAVAHTVLQGVLVLAVGHTLGENPPPPDDPAARGMKANSKNPTGNRTITLEITPEEAQELALAASRGGLLLSLRGLTDVSTVEMQYQTADAMLGLEALRPAPPPKQFGRKQQAAPPAPISGPILVSGSRVQETVLDDGGSVRNAKGK